MNMTCKKCPAIVGDTFCSYHKKDIWREDEMCERGFELRIEKGVDMCCECDVDDPKIKKIMEQVNKLDDLWAKKFKGKTKKIVKEKFDFSDVPF